MDDDKIKGAASALAQHSKDAVEGVADKADAAMEQGRETAETIAGRAQAAAADFTDAITSTAKKVGSAASDVGEQAYERASQAGAYVGEQVKQRPLTALLLGVALGYFAGFVLHHTPTPPPVSRRMARYGRQLDQYRPRGW